METVETLAEDMKEKFAKEREEEEKVALHARMFIRSVQRLREQQSAVRHKILMLVADKDKKLLRKIHDRLQAELPLEELDKKVDLLLLQHDVDLLREKQKLVTISEELQRAGDIQIVKLFKKLTKSLDGQKLSPEDEKLYDLMKKALSSLA